MARAPTAGLGQLRQHSHLVVAQNLEYQSAGTAALLDTWKSCHTRIEGPNIPFTSSKHAAAQRSGSRAAGCWVLAAAQQEVEVQEQR